MIFGTFCVAMTIHAFFFYPETAKKSLEEVDLLFTENVPAWRSASAGGRLQEKIEKVERGEKVTEEVEDTANHKETV